MTLLLSAGTRIRGEGKCAAGVLYTPYTDYLYLVIVGAKRMSYHIISYDGDGAKRTEGRRKEHGVDTKCQLQNTAGVLMLQQ